MVQEIKLKFSVCLTFLYALNISIMPSMLKTVVTVLLLLTQTWVISIDYKWVFTIGTLSSGAMYISVGLSVG